MNAKTLLSLSFALGLTLGACTDDESVTPAPTSNSDAGQPGTPGTQGDASGPVTGGDGGTASKAIPLILWVDDLLDHHTTDDSAPDTVDDKNIDDNEDPTTFDKRFVN